MTEPQVAALGIGVVACLTDLRTRRIPNWLTFGGAVAALAFHLWTGGLMGVVSASAGWLIGVLLFFLPFALGGMGGGDLKLLAALGAWLGPIPTVWLALYTGAAGGVMALIVASARGYLSTALRNIWTLLAHWRVVGLRPLNEVSLAQSESPRLAYAVPILLGTVVTIWLQ
jgi:prepilin peptidase CpaA